MRLFQGRKAPLLSISITLDHALRPTECRGAQRLPVAQQCLGRGRKWRQGPRYLGDAGNSGLANRMSHSGGGRGQGAMFTRAQASFLAPKANAHLGAVEEERDSTASWEGLAEALSSSWKPVLEMRWGVCVSRKGVRPASCGKSGPWWSVCTSQLPQSTPLGYTAPF